MIPVIFKVCNRLTQKLKFGLWVKTFSCFCRFVDYYTLPSNNFTLEANNVTFHHSRLMGASDIENAVSILSHISISDYASRILLTTTY